MVITAPSRFLAVEGPTDRILGWHCTAYVNVIDHTAAGTMVPFALLTIAKATPS